MIATSSDRTSISALSALLLALPVATWPLGAQTLLQRAEPIAQPEFTLVVTFGDRDGSGFLGLPADVVHRYSGEWVVTDQTNQTEIKFFSEDGKWLRTLGRDGEGPGEFGSALFLSLEPDNGLRVFDPDLGRITQFSPDLEVVGTVPARAGGFSMAFLPGGWFLVAAQRNGPAEIGLPLHLFDPEGQVVRSFGADPPIREWGNPHKVWRMVASSRDNAVWSAHLTEYAIERWTLEGVRTHAFVGEVPWFEPHDHFGRPNDSSTPPNPGTYRVFEDAQGFVWLAFQVPDEDWKDALTTRTAPGGRTLHISRDQNLMYDTIIEVIDPDEGKVVATGRHPSAVWGFTNEGDLIFHRYLEDATPVCEIWRARF